MLWLTLNRFFYLIFITCRPQMNNLEVCRRIRTFEGRFKKKAIKGAVQESAVWENLSVKASYMSFLHVVSFFCVYKTLKSDSNTWFLAKLVDVNKSFTVGLRPIRHEVKQTRTMPKCKTKEYITVNENNPSWTWWPLTTRHRIKWSETALNFVLSLLENEL